MHGGISAVRWGYQVCYWQAQFMNLAKSNAKVGLTVYVYTRQT